MKKKVMLLMGGVSDENYLSIRSAQRIIRLIDAEIYDVMPVEWKKNGKFIEYHFNSLSEMKNEYEDMLSFFYHVRPDVVFIALHGSNEGDGKLAGFLDLLNIPYTGNGFIQSVVGMNKELTKLKFIQAGIKTPDFISVNNNNFEKLIEKSEYIESRIQYPCIVKPGSSGSSIGIKKVNNYNELNNHVELLLKDDEVVLIEKLIYGSEYSVGVFGGYGGGYKEWFPVAKVDYSADLFDENIKKNNLYEVSVPADISGKEEKELQNTAGRIHDLLMLEGVSRSDFILTEEGEIFALEVNTHPGLSENSIITRMMEFSNLFGKVVNNMIKQAECNYLQ